MLNPISKAMKLAETSNNTGHVKPSLRCYS